MSYPNFLNGNFTSPIETTNSFTQLVSVLSNQTITNNTNLTNWLTNGNAGSDCAITIEICNGNISVPGDVTLNPTLPSGITQYIGFLGQAKSGNSALININQTLTFNTIGNYTLSFYVAPSNPNSTYARYTTNNNTINISVSNGILNSNITIDPNQWQWNQLSYNINIPTPGNYTFTFQQSITSPYSPTTPYSVFYLTGFNLASKIQTNYSVNHQEDLVNLFNPWNGISQKTPATNYFVIGNDIANLFEAQTSDPGVNYITTNYKVLNYTPLWTTVTGNYDLGQIFQPIPQPQTLSININSNQGYSTTLEYQNVLYTILILTNNQTATISQNQQQGNVLINFILVGGGAGGGGGVNAGGGNGSGGGGGGGGGFAQGNFNTVGGNYYDIVGGGGGAGGQQNNTAADSGISGNNSSIVEKIGGVQVAQTAVYGGYNYNTGNGKLNGGQFGNFQNGGSQGTLAVNQLGTLTISGGGGNGGVGCDGNGNGAGNQYQAPFGGGSYISSTSYLGNTIYIGGGGSGCWNLQAGIPSSQNPPGGYPGGGYGGTFGGGGPGVSTVNGYSYYGGGGGGGSYGGTTGPGGAGRTGCAILWWIKYL